MSAHGAWLMSDHGYFWLITAFHECSWATNSTHDPSRGHMSSNEHWWELVSTHEHSKVCQNSALGTHEHSSHHCTILMSTHEGSSVSSHENYWALMSFLNCSWEIMTSQQGSSTLFATVREKADGKGHYARIMTRGLCAHKDKGIMRAKSQGDYAGLMIGRSWII